jgi:hypothetical protein
MAAKFGSFGMATDRKPLKLEVGSNILGKVDAFMEVA